jgi:hypothetical protein
MPLPVICMFFYFILYCPGSSSALRHPSITVSRARHDDSTGNLKRHIKSCAPLNSNQTRTLATYASGSTYTPASHRLKIALWIANRHRPFSIVEDPELLTRNASHPRATRFQEISRRFLRSAASLWVKYSGYVFAPGSCR